MTTPTTVTCGDLGLSGEVWDTLRRHDPGHMVSDLDAMCHCYPEATGKGPCYSTVVWPVAKDLQLIACCLCAPYVAGVLRRIVPTGRYEWLERECRGAIGNLDRRSLDGSACPRDMDLEAAALEEVDHA